MDLSRGARGIRGAVASAQRRPDELRALTRLGFAELAGAAGGIGAVHRAIADRAFGSAGAGARPARLIHDTIADGAYRATGATFTVTGGAIGYFVGRRRSGDGRPLSASPRGSTALAVLNGLIGDALEREQSDLQEPMTIRAAGRAVPAEPGALAAAFPAATPRIAVFLHGLMETELAWRLGAAGRGGTYASRLARDLAITPVFVRYNSGRHVSENGRSLSELLEEVLAAWPVEVSDLALIGHSMGGLVARSASHQAAEEGADWVGRVRRVITLGTPHMGAPVAQAVHYASAALAAVPETRPLGRFLRRRSAGIRDLRHGSLVDGDWRDCDPDALRAAACQEVPLLSGAKHCFVAATITRSARNPVGRLVGDCLVLEASASGRGRTRRIPFDEELGLHVGGAHHLALLNHPVVYERLREWLAGS